MEKHSKQVQLHERVMETGTIQKNGVSPKKLNTRSKENFLIYGMLLLVLCGFGNKVIAQSYNPAGAVTYANLWATNTTQQNNCSGCCDGTISNYNNSNKSDYQKDADCANFVSQCLVGSNAGGLTMPQGLATPQGVIIECRNLHAYLTTKVSVNDLSHYATSTVSSNGPASVPSWLAPGDVVIWWNNDVNTKKQVVQITLQ